MMTAMGWLVWIVGAYLSIGLVTGAVLLCTDYHDITGVTRRYPRWVVACVFLAWASVFWLAAALEEDD